jgi:hypothetical protein
MYERGVVQEFDCRRGGIGRSGVGVSAGGSNGKAEPRPHARAAREEGVADGFAELGRAACRRRVGYSTFEAPLYAFGDVHVPSPDRKANTTIYNV